MLKWIKMKNFIVFRVIEHKSLSFKLSVFMITQIYSINVSCHELGYLLCSHKDTKEKVLRISSNLLISSRRKHNAWNNILYFKGTFWSSKCCHMYYLWGSHDNFEVNNTSIIILILQMRKLSLKREMACVKSLTQE